MIICWTKPSTTTQQRYLNQAKDLQFSYSEVGKSANPLPEEITRKYSVDRYRCLLGHGEQIFECAKRGLAQWCHFDLGWVQIDSPEPKMGLTVAVAIKTCWVWSLHFTRVTYLIDHNSQEEKRWGFSYGTLQWHGEQGEERFLLHHNPTTDEVFYEIVAFSKPRHIFCWLGYPITRYLQKRFGAESMKRLQRWVNEESANSN